MNDFQRLWWQQATSDHRVFDLLLRTGVEPCHCLHYMQMMTKKISKAYFWQKKSPTPRSHVGFTKFLRYLGHFPPKHQQRIADLFTFGRFEDFQNWIRAVLPMAYELERLAPNLARDGPNPEYPWPHAQPQFAPANYHFTLWSMLTMGQGRDLMRVIRIAVNRFPEYADV